MQLKQGKADSYKGPLHNYVTLGGGWVGWVLALHVC